MHHIILLKAVFDISLVCAREKVISNAPPKEIDTENDYAYSDDVKTTPMRKF